MQDITNNIISHLIQRIKISILWSYDYGTFIVKEIANRKNNIKKPSIANAKNQQYKTAITSLKVANEILKDLQINKLEEKVQLMEEGLIASTVANKSVEVEPSEETTEKINKLTELTEQLANLKKSKNKDIDEIDNDFKMNNFLRLDSLNIKNFTKKNLSKIKRISSYNNNLIANKETIKKRSNSSKNKKSHNTKISQCFDN